MSFGNTISNKNTYSTKYSTSLRIEIDLDEDNAIEYIKKVPISFNNRISKNNDLKTKFSDIGIAFSLNNNDSLKSFKPHNVSTISEEQEEEEEKYVEDVDEDLECELEVMMLQSSSEASSLQIVTSDFNLDSDFSESMSETSSIFSPAGDIDIGCYSPPPSILSEKCPEPFRQRQLSVHFV